ncbi:hypothetical protein MJM04_32960, partial [Salmonella enterica subsp. enterica serovar Cerro]|nr:hypothetical protein [Salmonella enterica subsp. enterica serovar Cerro]
MVRIACVGITVMDRIYYVEGLPTEGGKYGAARRFLQRLNTLLFKQDGLQLLRRGQVERLARNVMRFLFQFR